MKKLRWQISGSLFILFVGSLWHFIYTYFPNSFTAFIAPINESPWQHLKLLYWPTVIWLTISFIYLKELREYLLWSTFSSVVSGCIFIIVFYFISVAIFGHVFLLDILNFIIASFLTGFLTIEWSISKRLRGYEILIPLLLFSVFLYYLP